MAIDRSSTSRSRSHPRASDEGADAATDKASAVTPDRAISPRLREIYTQASRLFVERGYEATSMSDIAEAVKITKAGLYYFVKSKEDLLFTIMSFGMNELEDEVVEPARRIVKPGARLEFIIRAHLDNIGRVGGRHGNPVTIVVDEPWGLSRELRSTIDGRKRAYFELIRGTLEEMKDAGESDPDLDSTVAAHSIIGMILWTARWRRPEGRLPLDVIIRQITGLVRHGLSVRA